jgi:hypothetical protein
VIDDIPPCTLSAIVAASVELTGDGRYARLRCAQWRGIQSGKVAGANRNTSQTRWATQCIPVLNQQR